MKSNFRRSIRRPGPRKLLRWQVALHEAGHAVAYSQLCGTWAAAYAWTSGGGLCTHGVGSRDLFSHAVAVAAGDVAGHMALWVPPPKGRYHRIRGPRPQTMRMLPDREVVKQIIGFMPPAATPKISADEVEDAAIKFVREHTFEIIALAEKVYLRGRAFLPAPSQQHTAASVSSTEEFTVAASAAKGSTHVIG